MKPQTIVGSLRGLELFASTAFCRDIRPTVRTARCRDQKHVVVSAAVSAVDSMDDHWLIHIDQYLTDTGHASLTALSLPS